VVLNCTQVVGVRTCAPKKIAGRAFGKSRGGGQRLKSNPPEIGVVRMVDAWSVDLTAGFANQDEDMQTALAPSNVLMEAAGSPEPESSSASSELDDLEMSYLHDMFQADALLPADGDVLLDPMSPSKRSAQPGSTRQRSPLEDSWVHTLNTEMDDTAASTHATCSPDGSDAFELREETRDMKPTITTESCPPGPAGPNGTPPAQEHSGHKRKADIEFPPVGAARTGGGMTGVFAAVSVGGAMPAVFVASSSGAVVLPSPATAAQHRFSAEELEKLDLETSRANDIVAALMARDPSTLSGEEVKLMKKHKRLIKNRESAQLSRQRKKSHLETLEMQVQQLEKERASFSARMERLTEENAFLKKQLLAQSKQPATATPQPAPCPAACVVPVPAVSEHTGDVPAVKCAAPVPVLAVAKAKTPRGSVLLAICLFAGMFFTSVDLFQDRLPQLYTAPDAVDLPRVYDAAAVVPSRGSGRVLLAASSSDESPRWGDDKSEGSGSSRELERRDLLVVTLLDHLVSQLGVHASPTLFGRVCRKLVDMTVLKGCDFLSEDGGLDAVRAQYVAEFAELNDVFVKDSEEVRMDAEFTFGNKKQPPGNALAKGITSAPPRPPTMPLPGRLPGSVVESWGTLGLDEMLRSRDAERKQGATTGDYGKEWRMLCPDAKMLLIADKPANEDMSVAARLERKQRSSKLSPPERLLNNSTGTNGEEDETLFHVSRTHTPLSMIVPRKAISDSRFAKMLPEQQSALVEVQCKNFDLFPLFPTSSAVAAV